MRNSQFQRRLRRCVDRGNLTVADLQRWFGRPYQTVRFWLHAGFEPGGGPRDKRSAFQRLTRLETTVGANGRELRSLPMGRRARRLQELRR